MLLRNTPHRLPSAAAGYSPLIPPCPTLHFTRLPHRLSTTTVPPTCTAAASRNAGDTSTSKPATLREEAAASNAEVYDKLIAVFQQRQPSEWRKLIAFSKQFPKLADGVLARLEERVQALAEGSEERLELRRLARKLTEVHQETKQYRELITQFREAPGEDWEGLVANNRPALTGEFFSYLENTAKAAVDNQQEQQALVSMLTRIATLVTAFDQIENDQDAMRNAAQKFQNILEVDSLEEADKKIDTLAATGQLDPALMLMMAKAYQGAKDTDITREEVRDIMAHLYFKAKESFASQQPPEVRILKHLLSIDDPRQRMVALEEAFAPGPAGADMQLDYLSTTPEALMVAMTAVLSLYESQRGKGTMLGEAAGLMNPEVIQRLQELQSTVRKQFM